MAKQYTVTVKRDVFTGNQWNPDVTTRTVNLTKKPLTSRKEAEDLREVYHKMSQEQMVKKFGEGHYHGLAVVEHDVHVPGEALVKWKKCDKMFTKELFDKFADKMPIDCKEMNFLVRVQFEKDGVVSGKANTQMLSLFRVANGAVTGTLKHAMYYDWIDCLRIIAYAKIEELPDGEYSINAESEKE